MASSATNVIADMVVGIGGDNTELKRSFADSARDVQKFAGNVEVSAERMRAALTATGGDLIKAARLAYQSVTSGGGGPGGGAPGGGGGPPIPPRDYAEGVRRIAEARTRMIREAIQRSDRQLAAQIATFDPFINATGFQQGQQLARAISAGFAQGNAAGNIRRALNGQLGGNALGPAGILGGLLGRRGVGIGPGRAEVALITGAFALAGLGDAFAQGETKLTRFTSGLNSLLRSASVVAAFFGPGGLLASAVLAATSFVLDFFGKTRDEAVRAEKQLTESIDRVINAGEQLPRLRALLFGEPAGGPSRVTPNAFAGGIADLQAKILEARGRATNAASALAAKRVVADLEAKLAPLILERDRLIASMLNPVSVPEIRGALPITISAPAIGHEFDELGRQTQKILRLYSLLSEQKQDASREASRLVRQYYELGTALDSIKNPWDDQAIAVRQLRSEIEKTIPIIRLLSGPLPRPDITRPGGAFQVPGHGLPFAPIVIHPPALDTKPNIGITERILGVTLGNMVHRMGETIGDTIKQAFTPVLGPVSLLFRALEPALRVLTPLITNLIAPIAILIGTLAQSLEPVFEALFPIVKEAAIILSYFIEIVATVIAIWVRLWGNFFIGLGALLHIIPGLGRLGSNIENAGHSMLGVADTAGRIADSMGTARERIDALQWGQTADDILGLGDAARRTTSELLNVPYGFRIALARYEATVPIGTSGITGGAGGRGGHMTAPIYIGQLHVSTAARSADELFSDVARVARAKSYQQFGTTARAGDALAIVGIHR